MEQQFFPKNQVLGPGTQFRTLITIFGHILKNALSGHISATNENQKVIDSLLEWYQ